MNKLRGQSALEYLVTYGWAILAIVIVAAVLWYFGVFNPGNFASQSASARGFGEVGIIDQRYDSSSLVLVVSNQVGQQINITAVSIGGTAGTVSPLTLNSGAQGTLNVTGGAANDCTTSGTAYDTNLTITFTNLKTGLTGKTSSGTIKGSCA